MTVKETVRTFEPIGVLGTRGHHGSLYHTVPEYLGPHECSEIAARAAIFPETSVKPRRDAEDSWRGKSWQDLSGAGL